MKESIVEDVEKLLAGDLSVARAVYSVPHADLEEQLQGIHLILQPSSVVKVLHGLLGEAIPEEEAQQWASFVRRGFVSGAHRGPIRPLSIDYAEKYEDAIVEAVSRLDEIGDMIDGHVSKSELADLIDRLHVQS